MGRSEQSPIRPKPQIIPNKFGPRFELDQPWFGFISDPLFIQKLVYKIKKKRPKKLDKYYIRKKICEFD